MRSLNNMFLTIVLVAFLGVSSSDPLPFQRVKSLNFKLISKTSRPGSELSTLETIVDHTGEQVSMLSDGKGTHAPQRVTPLAEDSTHAWQFVGTEFDDGVECHRFVLDSLKHINHSSVEYGFILNGNLPHVFEYLERVDGTPLGMKYGNRYNVETDYGATEFEFIENYVPTLGSGHNELMAKHSGLKSEPGHASNFPLPSPLSFEYPSKCSKESKLCLDFEGKGSDEANSYDLKTTLVLRPHGGDAATVNIDIGLQEEPFELNTIHGSASGCAALYSAKVLILDLGVNICVDGELDYNSTNKYVHGELEASLNAWFGPAKASLDGKVGVEANEHGFKRAYAEIDLDLKAGVASAGIGFRLEAQPKNYNLNYWVGEGYLPVHASVGFWIFKHTWSSNIHLFKTGTMHIGV